MRVPILIYVLLYLVVELIGAQLAAVEWGRITPLMVASAVADAMLVVAVLVAALVAVDLTKHRWRPAMHTWLHAGRRGAHRDDPEDHAGTVGVRSWRAERAALPAGKPAVAPTATYAEPTYAVSGSRGRTGRPFPEDDGTLL